jgi:hypothetical protein
MAFFALWSMSGTARVLCIGTPPEMKVQIEQELQTRPAFDPNDPFAMLHPILDEVVRVCDESTWRVAKRVRGVEKVWATQTWKLVASRLGSQVMNSPKAMLTDYRIDK